MQNIHSLSVLGLTSTSRVLVIMPHPDDEAIFCGGILRRLANQGIATRLITMSRGEASTDRHTLGPEDDLSSVREVELIRAAQTLGITDQQVYSFKDGGMEKGRGVIETTLKKEIAAFQPTHVICLEPDGVYGHPDHIALTKIVKRVLPRSARLIYVTVTPNFIFPPSRRMATKAIIDPIGPNFRVTLSPGEVVAKIRSLMAHKSQFGALPRFIKPLLFFLRNDMVFHEFYAVASIKSDIHIDCK